ncbi:MAG: TolC family protein [Acidobacteriota bacterium]
MQINRLVLSTLVALMLLFPHAYSEDVVSLTLEECIVKAMENNLKVAVEVYNPELAEANLSLAKEMFMPRFDLSFGSRHMEEPSYWWLQGEDMVIDKTSNYSMALVQRVPTGGSLTLSLNSYQTKTNQSFQLINPRYGSTLQFDFNQPLLRDFGFKVSRKEIIIAQNNLDISLNQYKSVLTDIIYRVQEAYWNLVFSVEDHKVKKQSLELAEKLRQKNKREVELGKLAPIELLNAEAVVASREAELLQAEALIRRNQDALSSIMNLESAEKVDSLKLIPLDQPEFVKRAVSFEEALETAKSMRPELAIQKKTIESNELNFSIAKNKMLPGLDLNLSYWSPGISGDRLIYLDDNPFLGIVVGKEKGSPSDSLGDAFNFLYKNWSIGLTLTFPLSNVLSRAEYVRSRMELEKSRASIKEMENQITLEVKDAVREIETSAKRVEAFRLARELAQKRLEAEEKKLEVGMTTNFFVLQYQEELAGARSQELRALVDYNLAWSKLEKAVGTSLENRNVKIRHQSTGF